MPARPIYGRFCGNPVCRNPIDPLRPKGTDYCDSSCRSQACQIRDAGKRPATGAKPLRRVRRKRRSTSAPRARTPYAVMRKKLDLDDGDRAVIGGFVVVGFCAETQKGRAIRKVVDSREGDPPDSEYVAVPMGALTLYDDAGQRIAEDGPDWEVGDDDG